MTVLWSVSIVLSKIHLLKLMYVQAHAFIIHTWQHSVL